MKVLFLLTQDLESPSGLGRYFPLAREMALLGHQVTIAALHPDYQSLKIHRFDVEGVHVWYVAPMHVRKHGNVKSAAQSCCVVHPGRYRSYWQTSSNE
jgi:hypothetical protein